MWSRSYLFLYYDNLQINCSVEPVHKFSFVKSGTSIKFLLQVLETKLKYGKIIDISVKELSGYSCGLTYILCKIYIAFFMFCNFFHHQV